MRTFYTGFSDRLQRRFVDMQFCAEKHACWLRLAQKQDCLWVQSFWVFSILFSAGKQLSPLWLHWIGEWVHMQVWPCSARLERQNVAIFGKCILTCAMMIIHCEDSDITRAKVQSIYFHCLAGTGYNFSWRCPGQCEIIWQMIKCHAIEKAVLFFFFFHRTSAQTVIKFHCTCLQCSF